MACPDCGTESTGRFCPSCGAALRPGSCTACGANLVPGARFCTQCGTAAGDASRGASADTRPRSRAGSNLPWLIGAGVLIVLIGILLMPAISGRDDVPATGAPFGGPGAAPGTPPPLTGTPREQADRLFNRIMQAWDQGDTAEARRFTPMAIQAYDIARPLDDDGLFHLATVHNVAGDHVGAIATAREILDRNPDHLLALAVAGEAAQLDGDTAAARGYYARFLDAYEEEIGTARPEYRDHARIFPDYLAAARAATGR